MANEIKDIGNNAGYLYRVTRDGLTILHAWENNETGAREFRADAMVSGLIPWAAFQDDATKLQDNYDPIIGFRYYINANYTAAADPKTLTNAVEITRDIVPRGTEGNMPLYIAASLVSDTLSVTRKAIYSTVFMDTQGGGATDELHVIDEGVFVHGDVMILRGTDSARVITVVDQNGSANAGANIYLKDNTNWDSGSSRNVLVLQYFKSSLVATGAWYEISRSQITSTPVLTAAAQRAQLVPMPVAGVNHIDPPTTGQNITLTPGTSKGTLVLGGTGTLTGNISVATGGSPLDGDTFIVKYEGTFTIGGQSITIFGHALTAQQALNGNMLFIAIYDLANTTWEYFKLAGIGNNMIETDFIKNDAVTQDKLADNSVGNDQMRDNAIGLVELQDNIITDDKIDTDFSLLRQTSLVLSSPQLLALNSTPIEIIPNPGATKMIEIVAAAFLMNFGTAAYATNLELQLITDTATQPQFYLPNALDPTVDTYRKMISKQITGATDTQLLPDKSVKAKVGTGNPVTGDGTVQIWVIYREITLS